MADLITLGVVVVVGYYLFTTGTIDKIAQGLMQGGAGAQSSGYSSGGGSTPASTRSYKSGAPSHYGTKGGKPYCGRSYGGAVGCCGRIASGGNCPETLNFQDLRSNNPCPGYYSDPKGARHHCCPDKPPYNGGTTCTIS